MNQNYIRNFCIIAHIDHGKSTLADRLLEETGTIEKQSGALQILDSMDLEREKGITIKSHAVRMDYKYNSNIYTLNLIDTPGHVDFSYEVSRSLASCEGAVLLVDASQGIEAQTMSNLYLAIDNELDIIPVINKIDIPNADIENIEADLIDLLGIKAEMIYKISAKKGVGITNLLKAIITSLPPPQGNPDAPPKGLIFDSQYDKYRGVVILVRVYDGSFNTGDKIRIMATGKEHEIEEIGYLRIQKNKCSKLETGEVGYIIANIKEVADARVGDTITNTFAPCSEALSGYQEPKPMVYSGIFPVNNDDYENLRESIGKYKLNDASLVYELENSLALGFGFRCGFLGMLHLEIFKERLLREFNVPIISTSPSVIFIINMIDGSEMIVCNPANMPDPVRIDYIKEPVMNVEIIVPEEYIGNIMRLVLDRRGIQNNIQYLDQHRVELTYEMPLIEIIFDFYDKLKSVSKGYASLDYSFLEFRRSNIVKVDVLINGEKVDAMSFICHSSKAYSWGKSITDTLADVIPKHLFKIALQASIGSKIIARSTINAMRKNVTAKCYGGDITRKRKLLEKQKEGKKRMKDIGSVSVPQEAFLEVLKADKS